jgi:hypothetical protein
MSSAGLAPKKLGLSAARIAAAVLVIVSLAGFLAWLFLAPHPTARDRCIGNLKQMDAAKESWALENKLKKGDAVDVRGVCQYLKNGQLPPCPKQGVYSLNPVGSVPTCSLGPTHGHTL